MRMRGVAEVLGIDVTKMGNAKRFRALWRAVDRREREAHNEERKMQKKAENAPNRYVCAREGCGISAEGRRALLVCSGRCPPDLKPSYCSKECQKQVRDLVLPVHLFSYMFCRTGRGINRSANLCQNA